MDHYVNSLMKRYTSPYPIVTLNQRLHLRPVNRFINPLQSLEAAVMFQRGRE